MSKAVQTYRASPRLRTLVRRAARLDDKAPAEWVRLTLERMARERIAAAQAEGAAEELGRLLDEAGAKARGGVPEEEIERFADSVRHRR
jgi:K+-sensing histidine kinase KdpD